MIKSPPLAPWVARHSQQVGFGLQVFPTDTKGDPARALLAAGHLAEDLGFDAFFVGDHPAWGLDCWVHMAALAATTNRIRLGPNVACAGYRHPVLTARLAADLDNLSEGRLILGLGAGWDANEYANLGLPFLSARERQAALEEAILIMRGVWGEEPFSFHGRYFHTDNARVAPAPMQHPALPLLIAGGGERITLRQVAQYADACQLGSFGMISGGITPDDIRRKLAVLRGHCEALGRPFETVLRTHFTGWLILAEDEARLAAKIQHYFPEGVEQRFSGSWSGFAVAATPAQAIMMYQALAAAGIQYFIIETLDAADEETIRLLAEAVVPFVLLP
jgi:alkanesulfonate monooxygenase SsuD/methylene tetrahydromethanopterin reductase-like flavin-dependent oxidoreductase (luciferase family)